MSYLFTPTLLSPHRKDRNAAIYFANMHRMMCMHFNSIVIIIIIFIIFIIIIFIIIIIIIITIIVILNVILSFMEPLSLAQSARWQFVPWSLSP